MCSGTQGRNWGTHSLMCMLEERLLWLIPPGRSCLTFQAQVVCWRWSSCFLAQFLSSDSFPLLVALLKMWVWKWSIIFFLTGDEDSYQFLTFISVWRGGFCADQPALIYPRKQFILPFSVSAHFSLLLHLSNRQRVVPRTFLSADEEAVDQKR